MPTCAARAIAAGPSSSGRCGRSKRHRRSPAWVGGETELDRVLELLAARSRALVEAFAVVILLPDGSDFVVAATDGDVPHGLDIAATIELDHAAGRDDARLDPDAETAIYRIVQESLTNAAKYARGAHIEVVVVQPSGSRPTGAPTQPRARRAARGRAAYASRSSRRPVRTRGRGAAADRSRAHQFGDRIEALSERAHR
jgi:hypothetical protein